MPRGRGPLARLAIHNSLAAAPTACSMREDAASASYVLFRALSPPPANSPEAGSARARTLALQRSSIRHALSRMKALANDGRGLFSLSDFHRRQNIGTHQDNAHLSSSRFEAQANIKHQQRSNANLFCIRVNLAHRLLKIVPNPSPHRRAGDEVPRILRLCVRSRRNGP
eukprot:scaffold14723_cov32-Tisochrysis_lutea.AAC.2